MCAATLEDCRDCPDRHRPGAPVGALPSVTQLRQRHGVAYTDLARSLRDLADHIVVLAQRLVSEISLQAGEPGLRCALAVMREISRDQGDVVLMSRRAHA